MEQRRNNNTSNGGTNGCLGVAFTIIITVVLVVAGILFAAKYALPIVVWLVLLAGIIYLYRRLKTKIKGRSIMEMDQIDVMDEDTFERTMVKILQKEGYRNVYATKAVDNNDLNITGYREGYKHGWKCKKSESDIGNSTVQEAYNGKKRYECDYAYVVTNQYFNPSAILMADLTGVILWDRQKVNNLIKRAKILEKKTDIKPVWPELTLLIVLILALSMSIMFSPEIMRLAPWYEGTTKALETLTDPAEWVETEDAKEEKEKLGEDKNKTPKNAKEKQSD